MRENMFSKGESVKRKANGWFWGQQGYREESDIKIKTELEQYKEASCRHSAKTVWREHRSVCRWEQQWGWEEKKGWARPLE